MRSSWSSYSLTTTSRSPAFSVLRAISGTTHSAGSLESW
jgi:hypothetical protein